MVELYEAGNQSARPNKISYVSLINAITRSGDPDKAERAEKVLFQMYKQYQDGHNDLKPTAKTIAMVLDAWQKSGKPDAGERAEALLDWMLGLYKEAMDNGLNQMNIFTLPSFPLGVNPIVLARRHELGGFWKK